MITYSDLALREIFHFLFLEQLLRISDPRLYVLKGGVNLRFFFASPRYSEDMDLDVLSGSVDTLKKNCYKILNDVSFKRMLLTYGIADLVINDPTKAKQTQTTQRFKLRIITKKGLELPTKVEFSRRETVEPFVEQIINPEILSSYYRLSFKCQHYSASSAIRQKISALAGRVETQARDVFDLYVLYLGGHWAKSIAIGSDETTISKARENLQIIDYGQYRDQVVEYLLETDRDRYSSIDYWAEIKDTILGLIK